MEPVPKDRVPGLVRAPVVPEQAVKTKRDAAAQRAGEPAKTPPRTPEAVLQAAINRRMEKLEKAND